MPKFIVKTHDVDGSTRREYKSLAGAKRRFEEMCRAPLGC